MSENVLTVFVIGVIALGMLVGTTGGMPIVDTTIAQQQTPTPTSTPTDTPAGTPSAGQSATVTFNNQTSNGTAVMVNSATLPEGGFVAIHAVNESVSDGDLFGGDNVTAIDAVNNTTIGNRLGNSSFLESGSHENVTVTLEQSLIDQLLNQSAIDDGVFIAVAYRDGNANQQFDPENDTRYIQDGDPVGDWAYVNVTKDGNGQG